MPDTLTEIDDTAFAGCDAIGFLCASLNQAARYAQAHGIPWALKVQ